MLLARVKHRYRSAAVDMYIHDHCLTICRELQHFADSQEHVLLEVESSSNYHFMCTKEPHADKLKRMQEATLLLSTLQRVFTQV